MVTLDEARALEAQGGYPDSWIGVLALIRKHRLKVLWMPKVFSEWRITQLHNGRAAYHYYHFGRVVIGVLNKQREPFVLRNIERGEQ